MKAKYLCGMFRRDDMRLLDAGGMGKFNVIWQGGLAMPEWRVSFFAKFPA
jgi:hypothetical protein